MIDPGAFVSRLLRWLQPPNGISPPPDLPLVRYVAESDSADWLRESLQTFATSVSSFLPGHFDAYVRIFHPFREGTNLDPGRSWAEVSGMEVGQISAEQAGRACTSGQAQVGRVPLAVTELLIGHLREFTSTPEDCFFALWEGHGDSPVSPAIRPSLELPHRSYHLFRGPIEGAAVDFAQSEFGHLSANIWWPADRRWCVATEIDLAWTYVGGSRSCIQALLADARLESVETSADAEW